MLLNTAKSWISIPLTYTIYARHIEFKIGKNQIFENVIDCNNVIINRPL